MYRFFVEESQIYDGTVHITGSDVNHIKNVLRMRAGEKLEISDEEVAAEYKAMAEQHKMTEEQVKAAASEDDVKEVLLRRKAVRIVEDSVSGEKPAEEAPKKKTTRKKKTEKAEEPAEEPTAE